MRDLLGTAESDRLGFSGDDIIVGNLGNDHIWGGFGNDTLKVIAGHRPPRGGDDLLWRTWERSSLWSSWR